MSAPARPVEGKFLSTPIKIMLALWALGTVAGLFRFTQGLGAATAMNDGFPWGIWIAFDVVVAAPSPWVKRTRPATVPIAHRPSMILMGVERNFPSTGRAGALIAPPPSSPRGCSSR